MSVNEAQLGTLAKRMWKMSASMGAKEMRLEGGRSVGRGLCCSAAGGEVRAVGWGNLQTPAFVDALTVSR